MYEASKITVCKLCSTTNKGLEVTLSLTVKDDFSWDLRYKGDIVLPQSCQYLQGLPFLIDSGIKPTCESTDDILNKILDEFWPIEY